MIKLNNVSLTIKDNLILEQINLEIPKHKIIMLLGENGCGKTSLIKCLLQQMHYDGTITYDDKDIKMMDIKTRSTIFSYIPQIKTLNDQMTCLDVVVSGVSNQLGLFGIPSKMMYEQAIKLMEALNIVHLKDKYLDEISGGQLQMVYIARCFMQNSDYILMDEPCTYLDYVKQHHFLQSVKDKVANKKSVLISIHDPKLAIDYADIIIIMHKGKIIKVMDTIDKQQIEDIYHHLYGVRYQF